MAGISVLILTRNEQKDLPGCLDSVRWSDDVHVLDSLSTDDTVSIAKSFGAKVAERSFDGYATQRNYGLHQIAYRHSWVLLLDADERIPATLTRSLDVFVATAPEQVVAARIRRRDFWRERWLKHAQISPFYTRLVRPSRVHFEREVNELLVVDGETRDIPGYFDHFPFSKGLEQWVAKHNNYSRMEAELIAYGQVLRPSWKLALFGQDFHERRKHQKAIFYRLPGRPIIKFCYMMFVRRAFLDGWPGVRYAILQCVYEYLIVLKAKEIISARMLNDAHATVHGMPETQHKGG